VNNNNTRWDALDVLRGLTILLMLMNLTPGSWQTNFGFLIHAPWAGWTLIDMVAPAFLFCVGCAMPLSFERRSAKGATRRDLLRHVMTRGLLLVAIGFFLNLYPSFDWETVRIPGVLQRIGLCYAIAGVLMLVTARADPAGTLRMRVTPIAMASFVMLASYWALLYFVPAPGFAAPSLEPADNWVSVIDRAVIGVEHFFPHWPVDGKVVFDPEGLLSTWPACFNVLAGALAGIAFARGVFKLPARAAIGAGALTIGAAYTLVPLCPMIKNLWTSTFALFSAGFALVLLGVLMPLTERRGIRPLLWPARIFGENPLLAYILVFLLAPLIDANLFGSLDAPVSICSGGQSWLSAFLDARAASLTFALACMTLLFAILLVCHRRRWILKL
jgi:predicted acyltransferase